MTGAEELTATTSTTTTTTTRATETEGAGAGGNSTSSSPADPIYVYLWKAQAWAMLSIYFKVVATAYGFGKANEVSAQSDNARETLRENNTAIPDESEALLKDVEFSMAFTAWTSLPLLIFYAVALFGIVIENLFIISLYIIVLGLEKVGDIIRILYTHYTFESSALSLILSIVLSLSFNVWAIVFAVACRKRVACRQISPS